MIYRYNVSAYFKIETDQDIENWESDKIMEYAINFGEFKEVEIDLAGVDDE